MKDFDLLIFNGLFKSAYAKCFGYAIESPLTETESKIFCNKILDQTGLSIGWKSVKNYSFFVINPSAGKNENPSAATLDTLSRYVLSAPYSNEIRRKNDESHYPYWFLYKEKFPVSAKKTKNTIWLPWLIVSLLLILVVAVCFNFFAGWGPVRFTDIFSRSDDNSLKEKGWFIKSPDTAYWNKKSRIPGQLTLFTLKGDNWPDPSSKPIIRNLLLRQITTSCFTAEVHLKDFIPNQEWQQAGLLLLEDTSFTGKSIRLSLAFNDYFGGIKKPREILVQAITSLGTGFGKPEEIAHKPVFYLDSASNYPAMIKNLENTALRIEKHGNKYRFLYSGGTVENGAFKEVVSHEFDMKTKYIGIFAIKGFTNSQNIPVSIKFFSLTSDDCN